MQLLHVNPAMLPHGGTGELSALVLLGPVNLLGLAFFWLTVMLAVAGSALSAFCLISPVYEAKLEPYSFVGQWFVWLATPLLWATAALSMAFPWWRPFEVPTVLAVMAICRLAAQALCDYKWRSATNRRIPRVAYLAGPQRLH